MRTSRDQILTSHVGSLPRPDELIEANRARDAGERADEAGFQPLLQGSVADIVRRRSGQSWPIAVLGCGIHPTFLPTSLVGNKTLDLTPRPWLSRSRRLFDE